jgi:hypothetical protein
VEVGSFRPDDLEPDRELAWAGLFHLMNWLCPDLDQAHRRRFWDNALIYIGRRADRHASWTRADWSIDGNPIEARFARFAGGWTAYGASATGVGVVAIAAGVSPHQLRLQEVNSSTDYNFALTQPIITPDTLKDSVHQALGACARVLERRRPHADQRRLLNDRDRR